MSTISDRRAWVLPLTAVSSMMVALDALVVATALSTIRRQLGASLAALEWTVNAYTLSLAVLLMAAARLGDRFGRRRMFVVGLAVFTAASAVCALAPNVGILIAARTVQGAGAALVMPLAMALLSAAFPPEQRGRALGLYAGLTGLAVAGGPVIGGAVAQGLAWQWIFWINVPIGLAVIPLALLRIDESRGTDTALDGVGLGLATAGGLGVVWGLVRANTVGWGSAEVVTTLLVGALAAVAFVAWEHRSAEAMMPTRLFGSRGFAAANVANFGLTASLYGMVFFIAQFFQAAQHHGPLAAGLRMIPFTASLFFVAPAAGAAVNRIGSRPLIVTGLGLQAAGMAWIAAIVTPSVSYPALIAPSLIAGAGTSMAMPAVQAAVLGSAGLADIGKASAIYNMLRQLGAVLGTAIAVAVFAAVGGYGSAALFSDGFTAAQATCAALAFVGALAGLAVPGLRPAAPSPAAAPRETVPAR